MAEYEMLPTIKKAAEEIKEWHSRVEQAFGLPTFHNAEHIRSTIEASNVVLNNGTDPLGLRGELDRYNESVQPDLRVSLQDLRVAADLHWVTHDTGNISRELGVSNVQSASAAEGFMAKGAEEKAKVVQRLLAPDVLLDPVQRKRVVPLAQYLTDLTKYDSARERPFAQYVAVVDQVGTHLFRNDRSESVLGLLREMVAENPDAVVDPDKFINFPQRRLVELVPDTGQRQRLLNSWNQPMPEEVSGLNELGPIKAKDILESEELRALLKLP